MAIVAIQSKPLAYAMQGNFEGVISHFYLGEILEPKQSLTVKVGLQGFRAQGLRGMLTLKTLILSQITTGNPINPSETFTFDLPKGQDVGHIIVGCNLNFSPFI